MKLFAIAAAALVVSTGALTVPAAAQHHVVRERTVVHRGPDRGHARQTCDWQYRHHHKVRVCRTVRYR